MRTCVKDRCQLKLTTLGAAKVCLLEENGIARVCEAHFCYSIGCVQQSWTTLAGASPVTVIASEPCSETRCVAVMQGAKRVDKVTIIPPKPMRSG